MFDQDNIHELRNGQGSNESRAHLQTRNNISSIPHIPPLPGQ